MCLAVMMLDGLEIAQRTHVVALGITTDGVKIPLGLWEGSTENATLARALLVDLVDRGLDPEQAILFVIDGSKALRKAIGDVFGANALVHRCQRHKKRNVCDQLPERDRDTVRTRMRAAWALTDHELARQRLQLLVSELDQTCPDAGRSLREGLDETLTLMRLAITGQLAKTLRSTNPCESMIEIVRHTQRNVKHWHNGDMRKRWTAAGMLEAEKQFRRIVGYRDLAKLVTASERVTTEETVGVHLRASATETLGGRLRRLMAEQADVRISGRIAQLEVTVPGSRTIAVINFESGKVNADHPVPIAAFARLVAQFMVVLPEQQRRQLEETLTGVRANEEHRSRSEHAREATLGS
jgi:hypothetical protein